jgi:hypothetical protein
MTNSTNTTGTNGTSTNGTASSSGGYSGLGIPVEVEQFLGLSLAIGSGFFIGSSYIIKKKALLILVKKAGTSRGSSAIAARGLTLDSRLGAENNVPLSSWSSR